LKGHINRPYRRPHTITRQYGSENSCITDGNHRSGMGAPVQDKTAPPKSLEAYGDTRAQTLASLQRIEGELKKLNLTMGDVVQMHIYMVADPRTKQLDFDGMMKAYTQYFGTEKQPNLPVRSAFAVAQLANPGCLIEIEVTAVRTPKK
ncbi:RidA family protein, partial [Gluconacetobacter entanii]|uniref:RidA family protein n=1 Tax=Gluconacetobacter entanii TaxID=108528 RepID=UPI001FC9CBC4